MSRLYVNKVFIFSIIPLNKAVSDAKLFKCGFSRWKTLEKWLKKDNIDDADLLEHLL